MLAVNGAHHAQKPSSFIPRRLVVRPGQFRSHGRADAGCHCIGCNELTHHPHWVRAWRHDDDQHRHFIVCHQFCLRAEFRGLQMPQWRADVLLLPEPEHSVLTVAR